ncbi:Ald_Xan_dh_C domain-containing protein [Hyphomicrobiales bacterium]|nr:Ald_Xan_dh_C domain-containing protein [Hyphomicrobiales bacterium]CAH1691388.1 Ald_Xan_dh_C domain-containing protein [Hyphomicrobiales bacterium]
MNDRFNTLSQIGRPVRRLEDRRHLAGQGRFVADIRLPGMRDIAFLRSNIAHGVLNGVEIPVHIDPGVVWTSKRLEGLALPMVAALRNPNYRTAPFPVLATDRVRYVGQLVAAVVAPTRAAAEDIVEQITPDIDPLDAVVDPERAILADAPRLHADWPDNVYMRSARSVGDLDAAIARADVSITRHLRMARIGAMPLETRGVVAAYDHGQKMLTIHISTQRPHLIRTMLADQLIGIDESQIRVIAPDVGGGFGGKSNLYPEEIALAAIALQVPYPVRWIEDRFEHLVSASQSRQHVQKLTVHATRAGKLLAVEATLLGDGGAYAMRTSTAAIEANMASAILPGPYKFDTYRVEALTAATNKAPIGPFRGVGRPAAVFAMERMMDETAHAIGMDPVEFRLRNMIDAAEHPYTTVTGLIYDSGDYKALLKRVAARMEERSGQQDHPSGSRKLIGTGYGCYTEQTAHGAAEWARRGSPYEYGFESARVRIEPSGDVRVDTGILSHGQGLETTLAQIAGDLLGVSYERVRVRHGDTDLCPYGLGTVASRSLVMAGGAVHGACLRLAEKVRRIAAAVLEVDFESVTLAQGMAQGGGREIGFDEIAHIAYLGLSRLPRDIEPGLEQLFNYRPSVETGAWSSGVDAARVEVDLDTGQVKLLDFVVGEDCGFVVNPMIADGQVIGGAAQGIGQALFEELRFDDTGQPTAVTLADYIMVGAAEMPHVDIIHQETLSSFTIFGAKGLGEGGAIAPPAAIANAVSDALRPLGITITEVPIHPEKLWAAIDAAEAKARS